MRWQVQIVGDVHDLEELSRSTRGGSVRIVKEEGGYVLVADAFGALTDAGQVRAIAEEQVALLNGAARLALEARTAISVGGISRLRPDGVRDHFVTAKATLGLTARATAVVVKADGTEERAPSRADVVPDWIEAGLREEAVAKVLRLLGRGSLDWVGLYRLLEIVEQDLGGRDQCWRHGWASKKQLARFRHTANSPSAVGDAARHGKEFTSPPAAPMSLSEAKSLVNLVLHSWLRSKSGSEGVEAR
jgi:hypothetical protein